MYLLNLFAEVVMLRIFWLYCLHKHMPPPPTKKNVPWVWNYIAQGCETTVLEL